MYRRANLSKAQSLVEYALLIGLVALVVIVAAGLVGLATQRLFGIAAAGVGVKASVSKSTNEVIEIVTAECVASLSQHKLGLWVRGTTNVAVEALTGSTESSVGTGINGWAAPVTSDGNPNTFRFNPVLEGVDKPSTDTCPAAVAIQSTRGAIAFAPLQRITEP